MRATILLLGFVLILVLSTCGTHVSDPLPANSVSRSGPVSLTAEIAYVNTDLRSGDGIWGSP
jgi:hypothetical protein